MHGEGRNTRRIIEDARREIAALVNRSDVPLPEALGGYAIRKEAFADIIRAEKPDVAVLPR